MSCYLFPLSYLLHFVFFSNLSDKGQTRAMVIIQARALTFVFAVHNFKYFKTFPVLATFPCRDLAPCSCVSPRHTSAIFYLYAQIELPVLPAGDNFGVLLLLFLSIINQQMSICHFVKYKSNARHVYFFFHQL